MIDLLIHLIFLVHSICCDSLFDNSKAIKIPRYGFEDGLPISSTVEPPLVNIKVRFFSHIFSQNRIHFNGSQHTVTVKFLRCKGKHNWVKNEKVSIRIYTSQDMVFQATFSSSYTPKGSVKLGCILILPINLYWTYNNCQLGVFYHLRQQVAEESSWLVHFQPADIVIRASKKVYAIKERVIMRCSLMVPLRFVKKQSWKLHLMTSDPTFMILKDEMYQDGLMTQLEGEFPDQRAHVEFRCYISDLYVVTTVRVAEGLTLNWLARSLLLTHDRSALAICLVLVLLLLMVIGFMALIYGRKNWLSKQIIAHFSERIEDGVQRLSDPILNNLTSPARRFQVPGKLTPIQLRRHCKRLFSTLQDNYTTRQAVAEVRPETMKLLRQLTKQKHSQESAKSHKTEVSLERKSSNFLKKALKQLNKMDIGPQSIPTPQETRPKSPTYKNPVTTVEITAAPPPSYAAPAVDDDLELPGLPTLPYVSIPKGSTPYWDLTQIKMQSMVSPHYIHSSSQDI